MATSFGIIAALISLGVVGATATGMAMSTPAGMGGTSGGGMMGDGGGMMGDGGGMMGDGGDMMDGGGMMGTTGGCDGMQYQYQDGTTHDMTNCPYYQDANGDGVCDYHQTGMTCPYHTTTA